MREYPVMFSFVNYDGYKFVRGLVRHLLQDVLKDRYYAMEVAVNEAVNNAIEFGAHGKKIYLCFRVRGRKLMVRVSRHGIGFDAKEMLKNSSREDSFGELSMAERGRGILLIMAASDYVRYNRQGNEVLMVKEF